MTTRVRVKPLEGRLVRHPDTYEKLPAEGKVLEMNSYWRRKEIAGDVSIKLEADPAAAAKGEKQ